MPLVIEIAFAGFREAHIGELKAFRERCARLLLLLELVLRPGPYGPIFVIGTADDVLKQLNRAGEASLLFRKPPHELEIWPISVPRTRGDCRLGHSTQGFQRCAGWRRNQAILGAALSYRGICR